MVNFVRFDLNILELLNDSRLEFYKCQWKSPIDVYQIRKKQLNRFSDPISDSWGAGNRKGPLALAGKLGVEQEKRQPTKMITMQVADQNLVNLIEVKHCLPQGGECAGSEVYEHRLFANAKLKAGLMSASGAEGITTTNDSKIAIRHWLDLD